MKIHAIAPIVMLATAMLLSQQASAKIINLTCPAPTGTIYFQIDTDQNTAQFSTSAAIGVWMPLKNVSVQDHLITAAIWLSVRDQRVEFDYKIDRATGVLAINAPQYPQAQRQATCTPTVAAPNKF